MKILQQELPVFLLLKIAPWSLAIPGKSKMIESNQAQVQIDPSQFKWDPEDWDTMLPIGQTLTLQISPNSENLDAPVIASRVDEWRWIPESNIIHLHLSFLESNLELTDLLENLS